MKSVLLPCLLACALPLAGAQPERAALVQAGASVLKIEAQRQQGGYALGSGVVVAPERVVTNCHVTHDAVELHVRRGEERWRVRAQAADTEHDLCLLQVPGLPVQAVALGRSADLKRRQSVTALGYTGGLGLQNSLGVVQALYRMDAARVIQSTNWFTSGASGGGLFDDTMRLVGVLTFRLRGGETHYFAAPAEWLGPLLAPGAAFQPVAPLPAEALAYWQQPMPAQPSFLQAITLERDHRWQELEALALRWGSSDATDPAAWVTQALALDRLDRLDEAQAALERATALEPDAAPAWLRLGLLYIRQGAPDRARLVRRRLQTLDPAAALELDSALSKP
jgi:serine protease Do